MRVSPVVWAKDLTPQSSSTFAIRLYKFFAPEIDRELVILDRAHQPTADFVALQHDWLQARLRQGIARGQPGRTGAQN